MFCPFVKGACVTDCVFINNYNECSLAKSIPNIESNTGSDQTDSSYIDSKLGTIIEKLDRIIKKY